ncbi:MAG: SRPBCC domain-containing protein [Chloroflexota bacterium]|nr:MAG: activator of Hsp90 ATPase 1 family protein [Chloroflexi bacterium OLB13]MEB2367092.1 SRPBCC domain-containing protein [Chloroflexota bacterium]
MTENRNATTSTDAIFRVERVFNAPRETVFAAYTQAEHLTHWWAPRPWRVSYCTVDLRPGGEWRYCMAGPAGEEAWGKATYREIVAPERLVYEDAFTDADGVTNPALPVSVTTIVFEDLGGGRTRMSASAVFASPEALQAVIDMGMEEGMNMCLDQLVELLATL